MLIVQLAASPFVGGPERQMLGLARSLPPNYRTAFVAFADNGSSVALLDEARRQGCATVLLRHDTPHYRAAAAEVARHLRRLRADVVCCNGYKPDIIGWLAARQVGVPVVAVSHGWTAATLKVRVNEALDRLVLRWMDRVVCVSEGQAVKVRRAGVPADRVVVIRNAIRADALAEPDPAYRERLHALFPRRFQRLVGAAGRLSPEKGVGQLVEAAAIVAQEDPQIGFVVFGEGPLRGELTAQIAALGLQERFVLAGFCTELESYLPHFDAVALPSFTEGLPVVVLEAFAAGVPVVATAVGGTPEVVDDRVNGYLVPPGDPPALARHLLDLLRVEAERRAMGERGRQRVLAEFTFEAQSVQYQRLFEGLARNSRRGRRRKLLVAP
jgi:glycosyltransferase involved in cell wall biosynthesis